MTGETVTSPEPTIGQQVATKALTKMAEGPRFADGSGWPGSFPILAKFIDDAIVTALAESRAETERVREALDGAREALEVARRDHRLADAGLVSNRQQYLREREKHAETVMRLEEVDNDLDTARTEVSRLTERLGRAEGALGLIRDSNRHAKFCTWTPLRRKGGAQCSPGCPVLIARSFFSAPSAPAEKPAAEYVGPVCHVCGNPSKPGQTCSPECAAKDRHELGLCDEHCRAHGDRASAPAETPAVPKETT